MKDSDKKLDHIFKTIFFLGMVLGIFFLIYFSFSMMIYFASGGKEVLQIW